MFFRNRNSDDTQWLTISDLMSGLMILFMFIAIGFMRSTLLERDRANNELSKFKVVQENYTKILEENQSFFSELEKLRALEKQYFKIQEDYKKLLEENRSFLSELEKLRELEKQYLGILSEQKQLEVEKEIILLELGKIKSIAETYQNNQLNIYESLIKVFPKELLDIKNLNAEIDKDSLTFIFKSSDSLFDNASSNLKENYKNVLLEFFPRYIKAIMPYRDSIREIRIEGHTSSLWGTYPEEIKSEEGRILHSYFENMKLSQARTNSVLRYVLTEVKDIPTEYHRWLREHTAAVGLSFSKPILDKNGLEDSDRSRRVTFRIITNADSKIQQIIEDSHKIIN